jgi:hypothetical protein
MKNLLAISFVLLLLNSFHHLKAQMVTYSGPVEYHLEVIKTANGGGTDEGYEWNVSVNEKQIINGSFFVTFTGGTTAGFSMFKLTSIDENIEYINTVNNEGNDRKTSQPCYDDRLVFVKTATPGDSRTKQSSINYTRANPEKMVIEGGQMMFRGDKYTFMLMGKMKVNMTVETYSEETFPCWDTIIPPKSISNSTTLDVPIAISGEKTIGNRNVLEGIYVKQNETSNDCNKCLGGLGRMVHGDVNCSYISKITTSWTLVKRNKECDADVTYIKGDVKINGMPAKTGTVKVGAGDVITTGPKSRISFSLKNGNELYRLGSKSKLQLMSDPCNTHDIAPISKEQAMLKFISGKVLGVKKKARLYREDFDNDQDYYLYMSVNSWFHTAVAGVRGQLIKPPKTFYASASTDLSGYLNLPIDPEKEELLKECGELPDEAVAFYLHFEDDEVKDLTVVKGTLKIENANHIKSQTISEGNTTNKWDDGTIMSDVIISTK